MEKRDDVFFEIVLKNTSAIIMFAAYQKMKQDSRLNKNHSKDRTADAAIDNIEGGSMSIDGHGNVTHLRNVQTWAAILSSITDHFRKEEKILNVFEHSYCQGRTNKDALRILKMSRPKFFKAKEDIKNYVRAAACEKGIRRVM